MIFAKRIEASSPEEKKVIKRAASIGFYLLVIDQITKFLIAEMFNLGNTVPVIPHFFSLTYLTNTGAAWGILAGKGWLLLSISIIVLAGIIFYLSDIADGWAERYFALMLIASGIIGNSIDRIFRGEVVDFLYFYIGRFQWPAFNVADMCISCGVILFILSMIIRPESEKAAKNDKSASE